ncbi:MAG: ribonuclease HII [Thermodesulfovibrionales bacterium]|nr:ribonuclease HII [Thermodesulfovibrionales bacterium]
MDIYQHDESLRKKGFPLIAGIDEAGRGPLAGPVVAAAVVLKTGTRIDGLRDSKKVPEKERESLFSEIKNTAVDMGIGIVDHADIDRLNILRATRYAMKLAVENLSLQPDLLIIDAVSLPSVSIHQLTPVKGESVSASVAAASIIAKCVRDKIMIDYHKLYPQYNFSKHKGYSTREHMQKLQEFGPCPIHRRSFCKVMSVQLPL